MKTALLIIVSLFLVSLVNGQNTGINIDPPEHTLDVRSLTITDAAELNISNIDKSRYVRFFSGDDTFQDPSLTWSPSFNFRFATFDDNTLAFNEYMRISSLGDVGIGLVNPQAKLDILGGDWNLDAGNPGDLRIGDATYNFRIGIATGGGGAGITRMYSQGNSLNLGTNNRPSLSIGKNENVGIGSMDPKARLEIHSAGLSDTLLLLKNATVIGSKDYGIYFNDENAGATVGAYFDVEEEAIIAKNNTSSSLATIDAFNFSNTGSTFGLKAGVNSSDGTGVQGVGPKNGVYGFSSAANSNGIGVRGRATGTNSKGVEGVATGSNGIGVYADGQKGVYAHSDSNTGIALEAYNSSASGDTRGIDVTVNSPDGIGVYSVGPKYGVYGFSSAANANGRGVRGRATGSDGQGVRGEAIGNDGHALHGEATGIYGKGVYASITSDHSSSNAILAVSGGGNSYAAWLSGRVHVAGVLTKSSGTFKIDHPLDPENKYLSHSFVESPDMMNIYNGNIVTDKNGNATVNLPGYFEALNIDFRYQLTVIGEFAQAIVSEKIEGNSFKIKTDKPNIEVSWQVTGIRNDAFAKKNRIQVEEDKEVENQGKYLTPMAHGKSKEKSIGYIGIGKHK